MGHLPYFAAKINKTRYLKGLIKILMATLHINTLGVL